MKQPLLIIGLSALILAGIWFTRKTPAPEVPAVPGSPKPSVAHTVPLAEQSSPVSPAAKAPSAPTPVPTKDEVVVSLGKVEDVGKAAAGLLMHRAERATLTAIKPEDRTPAQAKRWLELERAHATTMGLLPEITAFQNSADEYGRFYGALITEAAGLDEASSRQITEFMRQRGQAMIQAGLNAAQEPTDDAAEQAWEAKRDEFNEITAEGVIAKLPPGVAEKIGFDDKFLELMEQDFDQATK